VYLIQYYVKKFVSDLQHWFSPGTAVSSTNKTDCHNITEILLKVVLNTIDRADLLYDNFFDKFHLFTVDRRHGCKWCKCMYTFHYEATNDVPGCVRKIKEAGRKVRKKLLMFTTN